MNLATWRNGDEVVAGYWLYFSNRDICHITLYSIDPLTHRKKIVLVDGPKPEWDGWKLC